MNRHSIAALLRRLYERQVTPESALEELRHLPYADLGFAAIDHHRVLRKGFPEVVYGEGKSVEQLEAIIRHLAERGSDILATRLPPEVAARLTAVLPAAEYSPTARTLRLRQGAPPPGVGKVLVVAAGTADLPVAEEAAVTADTLGSATERLYDVGVAGIHRLLDRRALLEAARVLVVVAGMDGALPSVIGGLVERPVIAVPTSVGYGASFGGLAALLAMLNSCASGIAVVNIDNGFGAGFMAHSINTLPALPEPQPEAKVGQQAAATGNDAPHLP
ncbi:MAG: nickel pincer cofactor biosynthesis protein LarB [Candidatus Tectomicrobia bacterium]|nr:nickel pincer cofactor biosynthesis protein LarB [Candidatus Tectomicrobia bacterium]